MFSLIALPWVCLLVTPCIVRPILGTDTFHCTKARWDSGMPPSRAAGEVFAHARDGRFYVIVDNDLMRDGMASEIDRQIGDRFNAMA